jgi:putative membrane protein
MLQPSMVKNDSRAKIIIWIVSIIVFAAVAFLAKFKLNIDLGFNVHVFAKFNAIINSVVAILLLAGLAQ